MQSTEVTTLSLDCAYLVRRRSSRLKMGNHMLQKIGLYMVIPCNIWNFFFSRTSICFISDQQLCSAATISFLPLTFLFGPPKISNKRKQYAVFYVGSLLIIKKEKKVWKSVESPFYFLYPLLMSGLQTVLFQICFVLPSLQGESIVCGVRSLISLFKILLRFCLFCSGTTWGTTQGQHK